MSAGKRIREYASGFGKKVEHSPVEENALFKGALSQGATPCKSKGKKNYSFHKFLFQRSFGPQDGEKKDGLQRFLELNV